MKIFDATSLNVVVKWLLATPMMLVGLLATGTAEAGPWSRATGEARVMRSATEDLRNRLERLYRHSPATQYAVASDELAKSLIELTRGYVPQASIEAELTRFNEVYEITRSLIASEYRIASDKNIKRYTDQIEGRFNKLVNDLGRAKPPVVAYAPLPVAPPIRYAPDYSARTVQPEWYSEELYAPQIELRGQIRSQTAPRPVAPVVQPYQSYRPQVAPQYSLPQPRISL